MKEPLSIHLDSEHVILRQLGEEVPEPATLSGYIVLDLADRHDIKDLRSVRSFVIKNASTKSVSMRHEFHIWYKAS